MTNASAMPRDLSISNYLNEVYADWQNSREQFPRNTYPPVHWPIPFFGNPASALVATVGVNPSSMEFEAGRGWPAPTRANRGAWKHRLKSYFNHATLADDWFNPWRIGLALLDCSYEAGTAAHFDVSYRPTKAMLKNQSTDPKEFRTMVERDVQWLFKLLPLCPNLRVLLTMGPVIGANLQPAGLCGFLHESASRHGFNVIHNGGFWEFCHEESRKILVIHDADTPDEKCITCRVVKNLHEYRDELRARIRECN
jgi:hypothetical protein